MNYPATHLVIVSYNKLLCINHFHPPYWPSCQWKPNFKQRFHQIHSVHIELQFHHGFTSTLRPKLWNLVKNAWVLKNWPRLGDIPQLYPLHEFSQFLSTLLKSASLHEFTQVWGMWCTSSPPLPLMDLHTLYAFFIRTQLKKIECAPTLGP